MEQHLSNSNLVKPMPHDEYSNRRMELLSNNIKSTTDASNAEKEIFYNYFIPLLSDVDKKYFDNTTFYHFKANEDLRIRNYTLDTLTRLPFADIAIVLHGGILTPTNRTVIRFTVHSQDNFTVGLYLINGNSKYRAVITTEYDLLDNTSTDHLDDSYLSHVPIKNRPKIFNSFKRFAIAMLNDFIDAYEAYEPVQVDNKLTDVKRKLKTNTPHPLASGRSEFIFDLNKPRPKNIRASTGTHARPCEHIRRPHKRTLRNGKVIWVAQKIINKGVGKSVKKEYML